MGHPCPRLADPGKFDLALVLPNSPRSAMEVFFAKIPNRTGYARRPWRNLFLTQAVAARAGAVQMRKRDGSGNQGPDPQIRRPRARPTPLPHTRFTRISILTAALGANPEPLPPKLVVTPEEVEAVKKNFGLETLMRPHFQFEPRSGIRPGETLAGGEIQCGGQRHSIADKLPLADFGGKNDAPTATRSAKRSTTKTSPARPRCAN